MSTLVFDGDCAFCTSSVRVLERLGLKAVTTVPYQRADLAALGLTEQQCHDKVQWVDGGRISSGHRAIARLLLAGPVWWRPLGRLMLLPPLSWLASAVYDVIAANRSRLPGGTPACSIPQNLKPLERDP